MQEKLIEYDNWIILPIESSGADADELINRLCNNLVPENKMEASSCKNINKFNQPTFF